MDLCTTTLHTNPGFQAVMVSNVESHHTVVIVGAGLSGLYAAQVLQRHVPDVLVVEAQDRVGGRIQQVHGLGPWPIEAGPEFIHGNNSTFTEVVQDFNFEFIEKPWPDWWYFGRERRLIDSTTTDEEVERVHELFDTVGDEAPPSPSTDMSAEQWLRSRGATDKMLAVAEACYANDFGCSIKQLGLREMITENQRWDSGETYLIMDRSLSHVVDQLATGLNITTNWPVHRIEYSATGVLLLDPDGRRISADKVIVSVPLKILQTGKLQFSPALPAYKTAAIQRLRMGNAVKIMVAFKQRFWPERMYDVVCTDMFVPEFWMTQHTPVDATCTHHVITGFIAGERADVVSRMDPQQAIQAFLQQLNTMFGTQQHPHPATSAYVTAHVFDWSKQEWVGAAYSYPTLGAEPTDRDALAAPVLSSIFFAGEATHPAVNPCMQAALDTGRRAAYQVKAALQQPTSKL
eukprot:jgi/Chrzof1/9892/Cz04g19260.t1